MDEATEKLRNYIVEVSKVARAEGILYSKGERLFQDEADGIIDEFNMWLVGQGAMRSTGHYSHGDYFVMEPLRLK